MFIYFLPRVKAMKFSIYYKTNTKPFQINVFQTKIQFAKNLILVHLIFVVVAILAIMSSKCCLFCIHLLESLPRDACHRICLTFVTCNSVFFPGFDTIRLKFTTKTATNDKVCLNFRLNCVIPILLMKY